MNKTFDNRAWLFVLPVVALVAFNAIIPLMTVVNYSVQETFGDNVFFWAGVMWFEQVLTSERFHDALFRQLAFTFTILLIEIPLGIAITLTMMRVMMTPIAVKRSALALMATTSMMMRALITQLPWSTQQWR